MPLASKSGLVVAVALPLLLIAGSAAADERCTGTLCDLYYGGPPPQPASGQASQAPKPVTVPSGGILGFFSGNKAAPADGTAAAPAAPASRPMVSVGGGGLLGAFRGGAQERCTGTLCDLYYGGPPPEKPEAAQPTRGAEATAQAAPAAMAETPAEALPPLPETREAPKRCIAKGGDPWSCFRH